MEIMPASIINKKDALQHYYDQLKTTKNYSCPILKNSEKILIPGQEWLVINSVKQEVLLLRVVKNIDNVLGIDHNYGDKQFIYNEIIEEKTLSKDFIIPGTGRELVLLDLSLKHKTKNIEIKSNLLKELDTNSRIYDFLMDEDQDIEDCIAIKLNGKWGFLFYTKKKEGEYDFKYETVRNINAEGVRLNQFQEGYKDFVYFILSTGKPEANKIGRSDDPDHRFKSLDGSNPAVIKLLLVLPDGRKEKMYHEMFREYRIFGKKEWFWQNDKLNNFIKEEKTKQKLIENIYLKQIKEQKSCNEKYMK